MYNDILKHNDDLIGRDILIITVDEWNLKHLTRTKFYSQFLATGDNTAVILLLF